jgi:thiazolylpeptide-type bacteriocin precursor
MSTLTTTFRGLDLDLSDLALDDLEITTLRDAMALPETGASSGSSSSSSSSCCGSCSCCCGDAAVAIHTGGVTGIGVI